MEETEETVTMSVDRYDRLLNDHVSRCIQTQRLADSIADLENDKAKMITEIIKWNFVYNEEIDQKETVDKYLYGYSVVTRLIDVGLVNKEFARGVITKLYIEESEKKNREKHDQEQQR